MAKSRAMMPVGLAVAMTAMLACASPGPGKNVVRHPDGTPRWTVETRGGRPHGASETRHPGGSVASRGTYAEGRRDGLFQYWAIDGTLERKEIYRNGELVWKGAADAEPPSQLPVVRTPRAAPVPPVHTEPSFRTLDPTRSGVLADLQIGLHRFSVTSDDDRWGRRATLYTQYAPGLLGGYAQLSTAWFGGSGELMATAGKTVAQAGGLAQVSIGGDDLFVRVGVFAPIGGDDLSGFSVDAATGFERYVDVATTLPRVWGARLSTSFQGTRNALFFRVDAGLDVVLDRSTATSVRFTGGNELLGRLNGGFGFGNERVAGSLELVASKFLTDTGGLESFGATIGLAVRWHGAPSNPAITLVSPVNGHRYGDLLVFAFAVDSSLGEWL